MASAAARSFIVPDAFGIVEPNVYRCSSITDQLNFPFIRSLQLKTFLYLSPDSPSATFRKFLEESNIQFLHLGLKAWKPVLTWKPISEELIKEALEVVLDVTNHPIMVACSSGVHQTGTLVGCLRRLQWWDLTSIMDEYRRYAGNRYQFESEQFIELFDCDLVTLPQALPPWLAFQRQMMQEEQALFERIAPIQHMTDAPAYVRHYFDISCPLRSERAAEAAAAATAARKVAKIKPPTLEADAAMP